MNVTSEALQSASRSLHSSQLMDEIAVFERIIYKSRNQHRRTLYYRSLLPVYRGVLQFKEFKFSTCLFPILDLLKIVLKNSNSYYAPNSIWAGKSVRNQEYFPIQRLAISKFAEFFELLEISRTKIISAIRLLDYIIPSIVYASKKVTSVISLGFFLPSALTIFSCLSRFFVCMNQLILDSIHAYNILSKSYEEANTRFTNSYVFKRMRNDEKLDLKNNSKLPTCIESKWEKNKIIINYKFSDINVDTGATSDINNNNTGSAAIQTRKMLDIIEAKKRELLEQLIGKDDKFCKKVELNSQDVTDTTNCNDNHDNNNSSICNHNDENEDGIYQCMENGAVREKQKTDIIDEKSIFIGSARGCKRESEVDHSNGTINDSERNTFKERKFRNDNNGVSQLLRKRKRGIKQTTFKEEKDEIAVLSASSSFSSLLSSSSSFCSARDIAATSPCHENKKAKRTIVTFDSSICSSSSFSSDFHSALSSLDVPLPHKPGSSFSSLSSISVSPVLDVPVFVKKRNHFENPNFDSSAWIATMDFVSTTLPPAVLPSSVSSSISSLSISMGLTAPGSSSLLPLSSPTVINSTTSLSEASSLLISSSVATEATKTTGTESTEAENIPTAAAATVAIMGESFPKKVAREITIAVRGNNITVAAPKDENVITAAESVAESKNTKMNSNPVAYSNASFSLSAHVTPFNPYSTFSSTLMNDLSITKSSYAHTPTSTAPPLPHAFSSPPSSSSSPSSSSPLSSSSPSPSPSSSTFISPPPYADSPPSSAFASPGSDFPTPSSSSYFPSPPLSTSFPSSSSLNSSDSKIATVSATIIPSPSGLDASSIPSSSRFLHFSSDSVSHTGPLEDSSFSKNTVPKFVINSPSIASGIIQQMEETNPSATENPTATAVLPKVVKNVERVMQMIASSTTGLRNSVAETSAVAERNCGAVESNSASPEKKSAVTERKSAETEKKSAVAEVNPAAASAKSGGKSPKRRRMQSLGNSDKKINNEKILFEMLLGE